MTGAHRSRLDAALDAMVADLVADLSDDPGAASIEHRVLPFQTRYEQLHCEVEADRAVVQAFVQNGSPAAANALAAIARFASSRELAAAAAAGLSELSKGGIEAELEPDLGRLAVGGAWRLDPAGGAHSCLMAFLDRPGQRDPQAWFALVDRGGSAGALTTAGWLPPTPLAALDSFSAELREDWSLAEPETISAADLGVELRAAVDRTVALRLDVGAEAAAALRLLGVALADDPDAFAGPEVDAPQAGDFRPDDEAEAKAMISGFLRELLAALEEVDSIRRSGDATVYAALRWKWERDRDLRTWAAPTVEELMRELPRMLSEAPVLPEDVPACLASMFVAMDEHRLLDGDGAAALATVIWRAGEALVEHLQEFVDASPADALVREMLRDGVDLGDADSVAAWTAAFNARSFEERDAVVRPALDRRREAAGERPGANGGRAKRNRRRAARQARRRNRH
ncbi:MAG: hypothetical protein ACRDL0_16305 [Thermoleophilaceae bacterium]